MSSTQIACKSSERDWFVPLHMCCTPARKWRTPDDDHHFEVFESRKCHPLELRVSTPLPTHEFYSACVFVGVPPYEHSFTCYSCRSSALPSSSVSRIVFSHVLCPMTISANFRPLVCCWWCHYMRADYEEVFQVRKCGLSCGNLGKSCTGYLTNERCGRMVASLHFQSKHRTLAVFSVLESWLFLFL